MNLKWIVTTVGQLILIGLGALSLVAYVKISFIDNNGHINWDNFSLILLVLALSLLCPGVYGLLKQKSYSQEPKLLRSFLVIPLVIGFIIVLFIILAVLVAFGLKGSGAFS